MNQNHFIKFIESIGFEKDIFNYKYKEYDINLYSDFYVLSKIHIKIVNVSYYNDLTLIKNVFKKELRSIKLKKILSL